MPDGISMRLILLNARSAKPNTNGWVVRHASTGTEHAVIDEPLGAYIQRMESYKKWPVIGFSLAVPLDASLRVSQIATASR